jgi:hypothetical protein
MVVDIEDHACPCCRNGLHRIGEDVSERLDIVPSQLRVIPGSSPRTVRRPQYPCRACEDVVVQVPAPARLIEGGLPTEATVAQVLVSRHADHLPRRHRSSWTTSVRIIVVGSSRVALSNGSLVRAEDLCLFFSDSRAASSRVESGATLWN